MLGPRLGTLHNLHYYQKLMRNIRQSIRDAKLLDFATELRGIYAV
jgi:queuine tRNA-ribosyltransferase